MMHPGEGHVRAWKLILRSGRVESELVLSEDVVSYEVQSFDALMDRLIFVVAAALVAMLSALFGAWAGSNLLQDDQPVRVVIEDTSSDLASPPLDLGETADSGQETRP